MSARHWWCNLRCEAQSIGASWNQQCVWDIDTKQKVIPYLNTHVLCYERDTHNLMKAYSKGIPICSKPLEPHKMTRINCVCGIPCFLRSLFVEILRTPSALCEKYSLVGCGQSFHGDIFQTKLHFDCLTLGFYKRARNVSSADSEVSWQLCLLCSW